MPQLQGEPPGRIAPLEELVNAFEFEAMAKRRLSSVTGALIEGASRKPFERITLRPRVMVNTTKLDLSLNLFGQQLFTPIMIGPVAQQKRFHPEGELAMAKGAAAANATMVTPATPMLLSNRLPHSAPPVSGINWMSNPICRPRQGE